MRSLNMLKRSLAHYFTRLIDPHASVVPPERFIAPRALAIPGSGLRVGKKAFAFDELRQGVAPLQEKSPDELNLREKEVRKVSLGTRNSSSRRNDLFSACDPQFEGRQSRRKICDRDFCGAPSVDNDSRTP